VSAPECVHAHLDFEPPDPSVGIFGYLLWCDDCGAEALEFTPEITGTDEYAYESGWIVTRWGESDADTEVQPWSA
jgi:hypothetical protein